VARLVVEFEHLALFFVPLILKGRYRPTSSFRARKR